MENTAKGKKKLNKWLTLKLTILHTANLLHITIAATNLTLKLLNSCCVNALSIHEGKPLMKS